NNWIYQKWIRLGFMTEFILMGLSDIPAVHFSLFVIILLIYLVTLLGNGTMLLAIGTKSQLHNPMYFFLMPKMLENLLIECSSISFTGCVLQLYFLVALARTEIFLLAVMAYDCYLCLQMTAGAWVTGFLNSLLHTTLMFILPYCNSNRINQFYCDIPPILALSCASTYVAEMVILIGKCKAFSTCTSHLIVVCLFYGTIIFTYIRLSSSYHPDQDRLVSMVYGMITPMLNPLIYSLRNKEVKKALERLILIQKNIKSY
uniref:G-protein coupled receptors family 1 profile domain-containing protein n=1 Tax=Laticauda laticaudata TaxID=8630 RepID=A0A8C5RVE7_LATLA